MNTDRFFDARAQVLGCESEQSGIGTLCEKTVHAVLKRYFEPDCTRHEVKIGRYVADIVGENGIIEIQTRGFDKLRQKLAAFLDCTDVTVVLPIAHQKQLCWVNTETGEISNKRKSPKTGSFYDCFFELYKIKQQLDNPRLHICLMLIDVTEYRYLDGWSKDRKKGSSRCERIPDNLHAELYLNSVSDYSSLIPEALAESFTVKEYAKAAHISPRYAGTALNILSYIGAVKHTGNRGKAYIYERNNRA